MGNFCNKPNDDGQLKDDIDTKENDNFNDIQNIVLQSEDNQEINRKININDFTIVKCIGRGSFGKVMLVQQKQSGKYYAMKSLRKRNLSKERQIKQTKEEKTILQTLDSPFLVKLYYAFQTKQKIYMVMDLINGGELYFHMRRNKRFPEDHVKFYMAELVIAIEYLHSRKIIYRDLKPENILLNFDGHIKLTDFGLAKQLVNDAKTFTFCGTPEYLPPEILLGKGHNHTADWWSFGIILYELLVGIPPFYNKERKLLFQNILKPEHRLGYNGADEIKADPFFKDIDWQKMAQLKIHPPWIPDLDSESDLKYIDDCFTQELPKDTELTSQITKIEQTQFGDFTYEKIRESTNLN